MPELICPVCGAPLRREEKICRCENRHCFDLARSGYVNLLPPSPAGKRHGDDKRMVAARTAFLSRGYYDPLISAVAEVCTGLDRTPLRIVDAGCGEGTYTKAVYDALAAQGRPPEILGVDISTDALRHAARLLPEAFFCAASTAKLPLAEESADLILNIFSPFMPAEFARVLAPGGWLLRALPMERHLWELKAAVYDTPYENPPVDDAAEGFLPVSARQLRGTIELPTNEDVQNLFLMTPYYYKTGAKDQQKLARIDSLSVTTEFALVLYQKA